MKEVKIIAPEDRLSFERSNFNTLKHTFFRTGTPQPPGRRGPTPSAAPDSPYYWWGELEIFDGEQPLDADNLSEWPADDNIEEDADACGWCGEHLVGETKSGTPVTIKGCLRMAEDKLPLAFYESWTTVDFVKWDGTASWTSQSVIGPGELVGRNLDYCEPESESCSGAGIDGGRVWTACMVDFLRKNLNDTWIKKSMVEKEIEGAFTNVSTPSGWGTIPGWTYQRAGTFSSFGIYTLPPNADPDGTGPLALKITQIDVTRAQKHIEANTNKKKIRYEIQIAPVIWHKVCCRRAHPNGSRNIGAPPPQRP